MSRKILIDLSALLILSMIPSCSDRSNSDGNSEPTFFATAFDDALEAGKWVICWDQIDDNGGAATPGVYSAEIVAGDYQANVSFEISSLSESIPSLSCGSTSAPGIPDQYATNLTSPEYAVGDSINIILELPSYDQVEVTILK